MFAAIIICLGIATFFFMCISIFDILVQGFDKAWTGRSVGVRLIATGVSLLIFSVGNGFKLYGL